MKRSTLINAALAAILLLLACNKPVTLPTTGTPKIVFLGELVADDSVYFRAAQSVPVIEGGSPERVMIDGLQVSVSSPQDGVWNLQSEPDELSQSELTLPYYSGNIIQVNRTYTVTGAHPTFGTATATVSVPRAFAATLTDTASEEYLGEPCYRVRLQVHDLPETGNYYVIEVVQQEYSGVETFLYDGTWYVRQENTDLYDSLHNAGVDIETRLEKQYGRNFNRVRFYTEDAFAEHVMSGLGQEETTRSMFKDESANGATFSCVLHIPKKNINFSQPDFVGYTTHIQVKSISKDYYTYLKNYQQSVNGAIDDPFGNKIVIKGNIDNGLGVVGGVFRRQFSFEW
ncbi:MAG: DUF4249 family protein [Sphingobacteriales bacterium]|nr:MAG: DUF4249 family protein [Sphingobacteriales bacterium]